MDALYLTPEELMDHTGLVQPAAQRKHLESDGLRKGIHFFVRADGKIRLLRAALTDRVVAPGKQVAGPNFGALREAR